MLCGLTRRGVARLLRVAVLHFRGDDTERVGERCIGSQTANRQGLNFVIGLRNREVAATGGTNAISAE